MADKGKRHNSDRRPASQPSTLHSGFRIRRWLLIAAVLAGACVLWFLLNALPILVRFRADIIHVHSILPVLFALFSKFALSRPIVMTFHGTDSVRVRESRLLQWLVDSSVDVLFCVSQPMANELRPLLHKTRVITLPNGVDLEIFRDRGLVRRNQIVA
ncbi:MAG: glycosyltransferase, partial [Planctomycetes bacterium]|nr:glycosyltransferase [Planctomycetota bacterium]